MPEAVDVVVIGAGPAGSTIARLLAAWGYSVLLLNGPRQRHTLAESLPPSIHNLFEVVGIRNEVEQAGFYPDHGNTSWWAGSEARVENYGGGLTGFHVDRQRFDGLLGSMAARAGAMVRQSSQAPRVSLEPCGIEHDGERTRARFIVDASGRSGLLARQTGRIPDPRYRTIALYGVFRREGSPWNVDPHHTLIEAYDRGWAWSVPLAPDLRHVCFMADTTSGAVDRAYRAELDRTTHFRRLFADDSLEGVNWGRDASLYHAATYAGPNWILVGDAASFVDPLSSFGVKKAMLSAWHGAVVVNTCLSKPEMTGPAIQLFNAYEREAWLDHARQASQYFSEAAGRFATPFWQARSIPPGAVLYRKQDLEAALDRLRQAQSPRFELCDRVTREPRPVIRGREVVLVERAILPGLENTEYMQGIHLATLAEMAPGCEGVGNLYDSYIKRQGDAPLPNFLAALSLLLAKEVLTLG